MTNSEQTAKAIIAHGLGIRTTDPNFFTPRDDRKTPVLSDIERRAYHAAWRIMTEPVPVELDWNTLACPGARNSRQVDHVARIIAETMR